MIVVQHGKHSPIEHYNIVGYLIIVIGCIGIFYAYRVSKLFKKKLQASQAVTKEDVIVSEGI